MYKIIVVANIYLYHDILYAYEHLYLKNLIYKPFSGDEYTICDSVSANGNWKCYGPWDDIENIRALIKDGSVVPRVIECSERMYASSKDVEKDKLRVAKEYGIDFEGSLRGLTGTSGFGRFEDDSIIVRISTNLNLETNKFNTHITSKPAGMKSLVLRNWKEATPDIEDLGVLPHLALKLLAELRVTSAEIAKNTKSKSGCKKSGGSGNAPTHDLMPFGPKMTWFAVRSDSPEDVARALALESIRPVAWNEGIKAVYEEYMPRGGPIFVPPPLNGWVLAIGFDERLDLHSPTPGHDYNTTVVQLSKLFGEAHYYGTHRTVELHAWAKAVKGKMVRAYSYVGEQGEVFLKIGRRTKEETELGMKFDGEENVPDEENVLDIAAAWSVDPRMTNISSIPGEGLLGRIK